MPDSVRVLVVDDFEPFRQFLSFALQKAPGLQVIGEASDGLEAVRQAERLQPDLILLDIGLPELSGLEAARRIRQLAPKSKIIFLSQESSADVVLEALSLGALGYVVKTHAASELLAAVEAVRRGSQFVSSGVSGHNLIDATDTVAPGCLWHEEVLASVAPLRPQEGKITRRHEVQFYSDDASLLVGFTCFLEATLKAGNSVIVVGTESHRKSLLQRMQSHGVDSAAAVEQGRYLPLDVGAMLATFMVNDLPDPDRFFKVAGDLVMAAAKAAKGKHPRVAACGEAAPALWAQGKADAAIRLERLWDEIAKTYDVDILCGYVLTSSQREQESHIYKRICAEHSTVYSQ